MGNVNGVQWVEVAFRTRRLERCFNSEKELQAEYGVRMARTIQTRLAALAGVGNLELATSITSMGSHQLSGNRAGQFAVGLVQPYRLVFRPNHSPVPLSDDGGIDTRKVTSITIMEVVDYH